MGNKNIKIKIKKLPQDIIDNIKDYIMCKVIVTRSNIKYEKWIGPQEFNTNILYTWYNEKIWYKDIFYKGIRYGIQEEWYMDKQQIKSKINFYKGKKHGLVVKWYHNGIIEYKYNFCEDKKHGMNKTWWYNGQLNFKENYDKGKLKSQEIWDYKGVLVSNKFF